MAASELVSSFAPFISWMFLPGFATTLILKFLYNNRILTLPQTALQADVHTKRVRTLVIIGYLAYTIYASLYQRSINFYELLKVLPDSDTETIRKSFRKLARIYHPDKMGGGLKNERFFIELRRAHDCLVEPVKRLAYDRFGDIVLDWTDAITVREFYIQGIQNSMAFYIINPVMFAFMHWMNNEQVINYWQFSILSLLFSLELSLIIGPVQPSHLLFFLPAGTTQHNLVSALHTTYIALTLASNQIYNLLPTPRGDSAKWQNRNFDKNINEMKQDLEGFRVAMRTMEGHWRGVEAEADRTLAFDLLPLRPAAKASAQTVQEAASVAAANSSNTTPAERQPSAAEETYIHLLGKIILRARLSSFPAAKARTENVHPLPTNTKTDHKAIEQQAGVDSNSSQKSTSTEQELSEKSSSTKEV